MVRWPGLTGTVLCLAAVLAGCGPNNTNTGSDKVPAGAQKVHVSASMFKWTLDAKTFHAGKPIDFIVQSTDVTHGFKIVGTDVNRTIPSGAASVNVVWTPKSAGDYTIQCDQFCGSGHPDMFLTIHVQP